MRRDHCASVDSATEFLLPNKKKVSTPIIEWRFVDDPEHGPDGASTSGDFHKYAGREAKPVRLFASELRRRNAELALMSQPSLMREEFVGAR